MRIFYNIYNENKTNPRTNYKNKKYKKYIRCIVWIFFMDVNGIAQVSMYKIYWKRYISSRNYRIARAI